MKKNITVLVVLLFLTSCSVEKKEAPRVEETSMLEETQEEDILAPTTSEQERPDVAAAENNIITVSSSIIPLSSVINTVGWDYVEVNNIIPAWVSPHGFDLSVKQMLQVEKSEIVFLTWLEHIDGFLEKAVEEERQVHLADGIELLESSRHDHHEEDEHHDNEYEGNNHSEDEHKNDHEDEEGHEAHDTDPHVWLGKENIIVIANKVRDHLSELMPEQAEYFQANTESFEIELEKIYSDFASQTSGKTPTEFIVFHDAYNYLMQSVGMDLNLKVPFSENILHETGAAHMAELIEEVEIHGVKYVFKEPQFSDGNLQKFVNEYVLELGTLDPLGTDPWASGYIYNIQSNLETLSKVYE